MNLKYIISGILLSAFITPVAFAESNTLPPLPREIMRGDFCANIEKINNLADFALSKLDNKMEKFEDKNEKRDDKLQDKDEKREENRNKRENTLFEKSEKLKSQATTPEQQKAVAEFLASLSKAQTTKQSAIDEVLAKTRAEVDAIIKTKVAGTTIGMDELKKAMDEAFTKAKTDCKAGKDSDMVLAEFKAKLQSTHEAFRDKNIQSKITAELKSAHESSKVQIKTIEQDFKTTIETAKSELKESIPNIKLEQERPFHSRFFQMIKSWFTKKSPTTVGQ